MKMPDQLSKGLYNIDDKKKSDALVNLIGSALTDLKDKIETMMTETKKSSEVLDKIVDIVEKILEFNR